MLNVHNELLGLLFAGSQQQTLVNPIVFPDSSIVPKYRSYPVATKDGRVTTGMIIRDSAEAIYLRTAQVAELRIARKDIEELTPSNVSLMLEGLGRR